MSSRGNRATPPVERWQSVGTVGSLSLLVLWRWLCRSLRACKRSGLLFAYAVAVFVRRRTIPAFLQLLGAGCLIVVVLTHVAEALHLLPAMQWGEPHSVGHYLDLSSAVLGVTLLPPGFVLRVFRSRSSLLSEPNGK